MVISATELFERHPECYEPQVARLFHEGRDPFHVPGLHCSGMCTSGRVRHHLKHNLWRDDSTVIFVGFAANSTFARKIIDGAKEVTIFGEQILVRARILTINGFSTHADQAELLAWHR